MRKPKLTPRKDMLDTIEGLQFRLLGEKANNMKLQGVIEGLRIALKQLSEPKK